MNHRKAQVRFFIGSNGTGKTTAQKAFLSVNKRNLVWPANELDKAWAEFPKIKPQRVIVRDPKSLPSRPKDKVVYRLTDLNSFTGTRVVDYSGIEDWDDVIDCFKASLSTSKGYKKGGLFIDDYKNMIKTHGNLPSEIRRLFSNFRHMEVDIFMATHGFDEINRQFFQHNPTFYIFKSDSPPNANRKKKYQGFDELMAAFNRVQEAAKTNPYHCEKFPK